jgi:hypothetical protein
MKKWYHILWGSKEEDEAVETLAVEKDIDPADLSIENAYKTRWIWYHTILAGLMFIMVIIMLGIFTLLAVKL